MAESIVAKVDCYFSKIGVVAVTVTEGEIHLGDKLHFLGFTTDFTQIISSMQMDHHSVEVARRGESVGIRVGERVRPSDLVYLVKGNEAH